MKPHEEPAGKPPRDSTVTGDCDRVMARLQELCDARSEERLADPHLALCESCRVAAEALLELHRMMVTDPYPEPAPGLGDGIVATVRADARRAARRARAVLVLVPAAAIALAVGLTLSGIDLLGGGRELVGDAIDLARVAKESVADWPGLEALPRALPAAPSLPSLGLGLGPRVVAPYAAVAAAVLFVAQVAWLRSQRRTAGRVA